MKNLSNENLDNNLCKFGIGLFETIKINQDSKATNLEAHLSRMFKSIEALQLDFKHKLDFLKDETFAYILKNNLKNIILRITIFQEGYFFTTREIPYTNENYEKGFRLLASKHKRGENILYKHKTCNYFENVHYNNFAKSLDFDDMLFIDCEGNILETSFCNIFFIKDNTIYTPNENLFLLNGIQRQKIIKLCKQNNIELKLENIKLEDIKDFDFCFITNSIINTLKVAQIDEIKYEKNNKIYEKLVSLLK